MRPWPRGIGPVSCVRFFRRDAGECMLETLTQGFKSARERLAGVRELSDTNVDEALLAVRASLLE